MKERENEGRDGIAQEETGAPASVHGFTFSEDSREVR